MPFAGGGGEVADGGSPPILCNSGLAYTGIDFECMSESCCDAANDCTLNGTDVAGCMECLIEGGERCQALGECHNAVCAPPEGLCGTELEPFDEDPRLNQCVEDSCCAEVDACMGAPEDCHQCLLEGGGPICDDMLACIDANCSGGASSEGICDSGVNVGDSRADQCLSELCCDEFNACTTAGRDVDSCIDCLNDGGGVLCDGAIECMEASGCV